MRNGGQAGAVIATTCGRALYVSAKGVLYISRGYKVYRSGDWGKTWQVDSVLSVEGWKSSLARFQLSARLLRQYVAALVVLSDGTRVGIARDGIYRAAPGDSVMTCTFRPPTGWRPLNLTVDNGDRVIFGEYGANPQRREIFIYASDDLARSFHPAFKFKAGDIRHVHNVIFDPFWDQFWVMVGDVGHEPGVGVLSKDLSTVTWIDRGHQRVRAVGALVERDCLIYGTDSEVQENYIIRLEKRSGKLSPLRGTEGSSLYATRFGGVGIISTCVEPSRVNKSKVATAYLAIEDCQWNPLISFRKDFWPAGLFQFGTIVLPYSHYDGSLGMLSGQALSGADNKVFVIDVTGLDRASCDAVTRRPGTVRRGASRGSTAS